MNPLCPIPILEDGDFFESCGERATELVEFDINGRTLCDWLCPDHADEYRKDGDER